MRGLSMDPAQRYASMDELLAALHLPLWRRLSRKQQIATGGGNPIYLVGAKFAPVFNGIARTQVLGIPLPVIILVVAIVFVYLLLQRSVFGRYVSAMGARPGAFTTRVTRPSPVPRGDRCPAGARAPPPS